MDHSAVSMAVFESWCFMSGTYSIPHFRQVIILFPVTVIMLFRQNFSDSHNSQSYSHAYPGVSTGEVSHEKPRQSVIVKLKLFSSLTLLNAWYCNSN